MPTLLLELSTFSVEVSTVRSPLDPPPLKPSPATTPVTSPDKSLSITNVPAASSYVTVILAPPDTNTFTLSSTASLKSETWSDVIAIAWLPAPVNCPCAFTVKLLTVEAFDPTGTYSYVVPTSLSGFSSIFGSLGTKFVS